MALSGLLTVVHGIQRREAVSFFLFDFDKNGFKELSHWMSDGDGVLVMDRNGDGVVNDGTELFGDRTPLPDGTTARTGFEALATLDENGDGVVNALDGMFSSLKVWGDTNGDGISTSDELRSLEETGIKSIRLESAENGAVDEHGNVAARNGTFEWADGTTGAVGEMLLQGDAMHSVPTELLELSEELASMPELLGGGTLHDLQQAMARDEIREQKQTRLPSWNPFGKPCSCRLSLKGVNG